MTLSKVNHSSYFSDIFLLRKACQYAKRRDFKLLSHNLEIRDLILNASSSMRKLFGEVSWITVVSNCGVFIFSRYVLICSNVCPICTSLSSFVGAMVLEKV